MAKTPTKLTARSPKREAGSKDFLSRTGKKGRASEKGTSPDIPRRRGRKPGKKFLSNTKNKEKPLATIQINRKFRRNSIPPVGVSDQEEEHFEPTEGAPGPTNSSISVKHDIFDSGVDKSSEAYILRGIKELNEMIDVFVLDLLGKIQDLLPTRGSERVKNIARAKGELQENYGLPDGPLMLAYHCLTSPISQAARAHVLDALLHKEICDGIHREFFEGDIFCGIDRTQAHYFDQVFHEIASNCPWRAAQRWRSMTFEAAFQLEGGSKPVAEIPRIECLCDVMIKHLLSMIDFVYMETSSTSRRVFFKSLKERLREKLFRLFASARQLCFKMQRDMVTCRMVVTIAPASSARVGYNNFGNEAESKKGRDTNTVLGSVSFGLVKYDENGTTTTYIKPALFTTDQLQLWTKIV